MCGGRLVPDTVPSGLKYVTSASVYGLALCVRLKDDKATIELLVSAQRAWVALRKAERAFSASGVSGGTAHGMILAICLDKLTGWHGRVARSAAGLRRLVWALRRK